MEPPIELLEQALRGERAAIEALSAWCLRRAFRLAYLDLKSAPNREQQAEEIAGEASLQAMTHLQQFVPGRRFEAWLHGIVRNCLHYRYRQSALPLPPAVYERWVHDFIDASLPEMEALVRAEYGREASAPHPVLIEQILTDLREKSYLQLMRLSYGEPRAETILKTVRKWLRAYIGREPGLTYGLDDIVDWEEICIAAEEETEAQVLQQEFVEQVNERLAELSPRCRRLLRWYYLDQLRVPEIACLEQMSERTVYRRIEGCSESFRARLMRHGYFAELAGRPVGSRQ
jgi:RNA polymerase sigma factor (sigma-70 family)